VRFLDIGLRQNLAGINTYSHWSSRKFRSTSPQTRIRGTFDPSENLEALRIVRVDHIAREWRDATSRTRVALSTALAVLCDGTWGGCRGASSARVRRRFDDRRGTDRSGTDRGGTDRGGTDCCGTGRCRTVERRARDGVSRLGLGCIGVDVDGQSRIRVAVTAREGHELSGRWGEGASTGDGDLSALRVELGGQRVQCDRLKTDEVVSVGNRGGNCRGPGRVLGDHLPAAPVSIVDRAADKSGLIDFEPLECVCVHAGAGGSGTLGQIRQHGTVRVRPDLIPVCNNGCTSFHGARGELESTGSPVIVASERWVGCVEDWVVA